MSFILDALRKSESQRRLETVPEIMRVPIAVNRERLPSWAVVVMATLALAVVALIVVGWRIQQARPDSTATVPATVGGYTTAPAVADRAQDPRRPLATQMPNAPAPELQALEAVPERAPEPEVAPEPAPVPAAMAAPPAREAAPSPPPIDAATLPSDTALRAAGVAIPELDLQLLVTSSTPANRLVVINGRRYREGDRLSEGSELIEISAEGAVLRHSGNEFLLVTD